MPSWLTQNPNWPLIGIQAAFGRPANSGAIAGPWDDLTARPPVKVSSTMGTQHELASAPTGTCEMTFRDVDEALNPANASSPWNSGGKSLKPYRRIRWWAMWPLTGNMLNAGNDVWASLMGAPGSFADTAGLEGGIGTWSVTAGCTLAQSATHVHDGTKSMLATWSTTAGGSGVANFSTPLPPLLSGQTYTVSMWVWIGSGPAVTIWCNGNTVTSSATTGAWQRVVLTFVADSTIVAGLGVYSAGATTAGQQVWVDSVQLEAAGSASSFTTSGPTIYSLFQGHIERYPLRWEHAGFEAWADMTCVDAAAMMSRALLRDVATAECFVDSPDQYWPLWDPTGTPTPQNLGIGGSLASPLASSPTAPGVTRSNLAIASNYATAASTATITVTATAGTVLVLSCASALSNNTVKVNSIATSGTGTTTSWLQAAYGPGSYYAGGSAGVAGIWYTTVTGSGSITLTVTFAGVCYYGITVDAYMGADPTAPVVGGTNGLLSGTNTTISWTNTQRGAYAAAAWAYDYGAYTTSTPGFTQVYEPYWAAEIGGQEGYAGPLPAGAASMSFNGLVITGGPGGSHPGWAYALVVPPATASPGTFTSFGTATGPDVDGSKALAFDGSVVASTYWASDWSAHATVGGNNAGWTAEAWLQADPASNWQRRIVTLYGAASSEAGVYLDSAGVLHYQHLNTSGTPDATITGAGVWDDGAWHHVALSEASNGTTCTSTLYIDGRSVGTATRSGVTHAAYGIRLGYDALNGADPFHGAVARVGVYYTNGALPAARVTGHWKAGRDGWLGDTPGQRLARALTWGGWQGPSLLTGPQAGSGSLGPAVGLAGKYVSDVASSVASTENGDFYVDQSGRITLMPRANYYTNISPTWLMGENAAGGEVPYLGSPAAELDPAYIYNSITVTPDRGTAQVAYNAASQANYGTRTTSITTAHQFDGDALSLAQWTALDQGDAILRVPMVVFDPASNPSLWPFVLGVRFGDRVTWTRRSPGGTTVISGWVEQVQHDTEPGKWTVTLAIRSVEAVQAGIIGDPTYGLIGSTLISVY